MHLGKKLGLIKPQKNCSNENSVVCNNKFKPLMEENFLSEDSDMLECEIQAVDTAPGDTGQTVGSSQNENLQDCDKFDKALLKKRVDPGVVMQAKNCSDYVACKTQMGESFGVIPRSTL